VEEMQVEVQNVDEDSASSKQPASEEMKKIFAALQQRHAEFQERFQSDFDTVANKPTETKPDRARTLDAVDPDIEDKLAKLEGLQKAEDDMLEEPVLSQDAKLSVVLACANEGEYAWKTALKVVDRTPPNVLEEVIVVDDGSSPPMEEVFTKAGIPEDVRMAKRIRLIRHEDTLGLMIAKKTGGDNAKGDIMVFLDCHVSPSKDWYKEIRDLIVQNPKRMVVPAITDLDLSTWEESVHSTVNTKTYLTWGADFDWFDDDSPYVPVMSGGLLALSAYWWKATGGYDSAMRGWGGENLDQSLRSWLCGGEIMRAKSRIAHMWRTTDPRTRSHYKQHAGSVLINKRRVVAAWFGPFEALYNRSVGQGGKDAHMDLSETVQLQKRLQCKPFVHFLYHFRDIYVEAAVIPTRVFQLRERSSGLCLTRNARAMGLTPCQGSGENGDKAQLVHLANRVQSRAPALCGGSGNTHQCCSGIRLWSTDVCLDYANQAGVHTYLCDITGQNANQQHRLREDGRIVHGDGDSCLAPGVGAPQADRLTKLARCSDLKGNEGRWEKVGEFEPFEARLYREELKKEGLVDLAFSDPASILGS